MNVAVTAASGRLGHAILHHLRADPAVDEIVAVARDPARVRMPGADIRAGDYADTASMARALAGVDSVILISAPVVEGTDRVALHRNAIAGARRAGVGRVVYTSVIGNGAEDDTLYGPTQRVNRVTEADLGEAGLEWAVGRAGLYLDLDLMHVRRAATTGGVYRNPGAAGRCGYVSINELAFGFERLATNDEVRGEVLNLVGETLTQAELVALIAEVFGVDVRYERISAEDNIARFMEDPRIAARGEGVARMLTGCFEAIARGAFDVPAHFERAAGRPARSVRAMLTALRDSERR